MFLLYGMYERGIRNISTSNEMQWFYTRICRLARKIKRGAKEMINCKHVKVKGTTTKYYYCPLKRKSVDDYICRDCMLRLPDLPEGFEEVFGKGFRK